MSSCASSCHSASAASSVGSRYAGIQPPSHVVERRAVGEHPAEVGEHPLENLDLAFVQGEDDEPVAAGAIVGISLISDPAASWPRARARAAATRRPRTLACAVRHDGLALVVHLHHQLVRLRLRVAEQLLEHVRDVVHQVDRVVPDEHDPRDVGRAVRVAEQLLDGVGDDDLLGADLGRRSPDAGHDSGAQLRRRCATSKPVDEAARVLRGVLLGELDGLGDHRPRSARREPSQLERADAQQRAVDDGHALERPVLGELARSARRSPRGARRRRARALLAYSSGGTGSSASSVEPRHVACSHSYARPRARSRASRRVGTGILATRLRLATGIRRSACRP